MTVGLTFLGTGTSQGIPIIGCDCAVCSSDDPRDQRSRTSAIVHLDGHNVLIDATPELRLQCISNDIRRIDACLVTHTHADHIFGLDDIRRFNQIQGKSIDLYVSSLHRETLEKIFGYARAGVSSNNPDLPKLNFNIFQTHDSISLFGYEVKPLLLPHGRSKSIGFRIANLGYCTDLSDMPHDAMEQLGGVDTLVLGALRPKPHIAHLSIDQAVEIANRIGAKRTYLTHLSHHISHQQQQQLLPNGINLAYDGLKINCNF